MILVISIRAVKLPQVTLVTSTNWKRPLAKVVTLANLQNGVGLHMLVELTCSDKKNLAMQGSHWPFGYHVQQADVTRGLFYRSDHVPGHDRWNVMNRTRPEKRVGSTSLVDLSTRLYSLSTLPFHRLCYTVKWLAAHMKPNNMRKILYSMRKHIRGIRMVATFYDENNVYNLDASKWQL